MKDFILKALSIGVYPQMDANKKLVIQVATFDGYWTMLTMFFYMFYTLYRNESTLFGFFTMAFILMCFGLWLLHKRRYDTGRTLLHLTALAQIFITADSTGPGSGYEFYYFTSITVPFITFTMEEQKKGFILTGIALLVLITQQFLGKGYFFEPVAVTELDRVGSIIIAMIFMIAVLGVAR